VRNDLRLNGDVYLHWPYRNDYKHIIEHILWWNSVRDNIQCGILSNNDPWMAAVPDKICTASCTYIHYVHSNREWRSSPDVVALVSPPKKWWGSLYYIYCRLGESESATADADLLGFASRADGNRLSAKQRVKTRRCPRLHTYIHVLSLCHLSPLRVTWRITNQNFQKILFLCNSSHNFTRKRNELRYHCCLSQLYFIGH
jgi:hypothetical protein